MTTMREHLTEHHTRTAETFAGIGKVLKEAMDGEEEGSPTHSLCKALLAHVTPYAEYNLECCKTLGESRKAAGLSDGQDDLMPSPISRVAPDVPQNRAIPRFGQREIAQAVAPEFRKLVQVEDEE